MPKSKSKADPNQSPMVAHDTRAYQTLDFTPTFLTGLVGLSPDDSRRVIRALALLNTNERNRSLRVHELVGRLEGVWSASAGGGLRITFERLTHGRKILLTCSHHYGD